MTANPDKFTMMQASLEVYGNIVSPEYTDLQQRLTGCLSGNGSRYEDLRAEIASEKANYALVREFIGQLPLQTEVKYGPDYRELYKNPIVTDDPYTARQVGAHVLWSAGETNFSETNHHGERRIVKRFKDGYPHYIIGQKLGTDKTGLFKRKQVAVSDILMISADAGKRIEGTAHVRTDDYTTARDYAQRLSLREFTDQELHKLMDPDTGELELTRDTAPLKLGFQDSQVRGVSYALNTPHNLNLLVANGIPTTREARKLNHPGRLPDLVMGQYDIPTALNQLAVAFRKEAELNDIIEKYKDQAA